MKNKVVLIGLVCVVMGLVSYSYRMELGLFSIINKHYQELELKDVLSEMYSEVDRESELISQAFGMDWEETGRILEENPDNEYLLQAWIQDQVGMDGELSLLAACDKLREMWPENGYYDLVKGAVYYESGNKWEAAECLRVAARKDVYEYPILLRLIEDKYPICKVGIIKLIFEHDIDMYRYLQDEYRDMSYDNRPKEVDIELLEAIAAVSEKHFKLDRNLYWRNLQHDKFSLYLAIFEAYKDMPEKREIYRERAKRAYIERESYRNAFKENNEQEPDYHLLEYYLSSYFILALIAIPTIVTMVYRGIWGKSGRKLAVSQHMLLVLMCGVFWGVYYLVYGSHRCGCGHVDDMNYPFIFFISTCGVTALWMWAALSRWKKWTNIISRWSIAISSNRIVQPLLIMAVGGSMIRILRGFSIDIFPDGLSYSQEANITFAISLLFAVPACCRREAGLVIKLRHGLVQLVPAGYFQKRYAGELGRMYVLCFLICWGLMIYSAGKFREYNNYLETQSGRIYDTAISEIAKLGDIDDLYMSRMMERSAKYGQSLTEDYLLLNEEELKEVLQGWPEMAKEYKVVYKMLGYLTNRQIQTHMTLSMLDWMDIEVEKFIYAAAKGDRHAKGKIDEILATNKVQLRPNLRARRGMAMGREREQGSAGQELQEESESGEEEKSISLLRYYELNIVCYNLNSKEENEKWQAKIFDDEHNMNIFRNAFENMTEIIDSSARDMIVNDIVDTGRLADVYGKPEMCLFGLKCRNREYIKLKLRNIIEVWRRNGNNNRVISHRFMYGHMQVMVDENEWVDESMVPLLVEMLEYDSMYAVRKLNELGYDWPEELVEKLSGSRDWQMRFSMVVNANEEQLARLVGDDNINVRLAARYMLGGD